MRERSYQSIKWKEAQEKVHQLQDRKGNIYGLLMGR